MRIRTNTQGECPEQKLKFFSYIEELQNTRPLYPATPDRGPKGWVMDAWEDHQDCIAASPEKSKYINQMLQSQQAKQCKGFRLRKVEVMSERVEPNLKMSTPLREDKLFQSPQVLKNDSVQKQNTTKLQNAKKQISRLYQSRRPACREVPVEEGPFKMPISSVVYPVIRDSEHKYLGQKRRRIDRFHSFVARTVRR